MGEVYAVASGKGGTGKTTVCAGLSTALSNDGRSVLCIDCDVGLRNLDIALGMQESSALSFMDVCRNGAELDDAPVHPQFPTLKLLTAPMNCDARQIDEQQFCALVQQARRQFDYVFLDAPAGVGAGFKLVSAAADDFLIVTGAGPAAVRDAARVGELLELEGKTRARIVVNRIDKDMLAAVRMTIDDVMDSVGLPLAGLVPEDPNITLAAAFGKTLLRYRPRTPACMAFRRISQRMQGLHCPVPLR